MWFFTADLHLGHSNIIKYCKRPFMSLVEQGLVDLAEAGHVPISDIVISAESTKRMDEHIIDRINSVVSPNDNLVIVGDFCLLKNSERKETIRSLRDRFNCKNIYLILGNHDDRDASKDIFKCFDHYTFNVHDQKIFTCHYPCRSWEKSIRKSWMIYGHVHGKFDRQDKTGLSLEQEEKIRSAIMEITYDQSMCDNILNSIKSNRQRLLTLDVGVDNPHPSGIFGTPWSFDDIKIHMSKMA